MATSLNQCAGEAIVSFPLKTNISDLKSYLKSIEKEKPDISSEFTVRTNNPNFSDDSRNSGEVDEPLNSITVNYNNTEYVQLNTQITIASHSDWISSGDPLKPVKNKIDLIVTLESKNEGGNPRFVILVVPIVIDDTVTVNNPYLAGLAYLTNDSLYSLASIFNGLNRYVFYTTCLAPHGDKAFVYVNIDTIKISSDLYNNLLSVWTQQSLSSIQTRILDNLTPVQRSLSALFQNVRNAKNLEEIQLQINNIQATSQNPVINSMVETWPRYSPPYDVILNVSANPLSDRTSTVEAFQVRGSQIEGFQVQVTNDGSLTSTTTTTSSTGTTGTTAITATTGTTATTTSNTNTDTGSSRLNSNTRSTGELKCVPLDVDDALDASGNIQFDGSGNIALGNIEKKRETLKQYYDSTKISFDTIIKYVVPFFAVSIVVSIFYFVIWPYVSQQMYPVAQIPDDAIKYGSLAVFGLIILFGGFLIGATVARAF